MPKKQLQARYVQADGSIRTVQPKNGTDFSLQELQDLVHGLIQVIPLGRYGILVCDDEGKLKGYPTNLVATLIWEEIWGKTDIVVGDVLICPDKMVK